MDQNDNELANLLDPATWGDQPADAGAATPQAAAPPDPPPDDAGPTVTVTGPGTPTSQRERLRLLYQGLAGWTAPRAIRTGTWVRGELAAVVAYTAALLLIILLMVLLSGWFFLMLPLPTVMFLAWVRRNTIGADLRTLQGLPTAFAHVQLQQAQLLQQRGMRPAAPESVTSAIVKLFLTIVGGLLILVLVASGNQWATIAAFFPFGVLWVFGVYAWWPVHLHPDRFIPDEPRAWKWGLWSVIIFFYLLITFLLLLIGSNLGLAGLTFCRMLAFILFNFVFGLRQHPIHGKLDRKISKIDLPVARRLGAIAGLGLLLLIGVLWYLVWIVVLSSNGFWQQFVEISFGVLLTVVLFAWYENHVDIIKMLWMTVTVDIENAELIIDTISPLGITGSRYVVDLSRLGGRTIVDQPNTPIELLFDLIGVVQVKFDIIGGPDVSIFILFRSAWFADNGPITVEKPLGPKNRLRKGRKAVSAAFKWFGLQGFMTNTAFSESVKQMAKQGKL